MKRLRLTQVLGCISFAIALVVSATPASATPGLIVGNGSGIYLPGIPTFGCGNEDITIEFSVFAVAGTQPEHGPEQFDGTGFECGPIVTGQTPETGTGGGNLAGTLTGSLTYTRTGDVMTVAGSGTVKGGSVSFGGDCHLTFTSANPVTSFEASCKWTTS